MPAQISLQPNRSSSSEGERLAAVLQELPDLDIQALRARWRKLLRSAPPDHLSRPLVLRLLAYKLQARVYGDLDRETARYLEQIERARLEQRKREDASQRKAVPSVPPVPVSRGLKPGTLLAREYGGQMHRVKAGPDGFVWNGVTYASLSEIARLITGTKWNGPRFFGLRDKPAKAGMSSEAA
jgi:hypothetical protein